MCSKKNTPNEKHKIPSVSVTVAKSKNSTQQSSIKTFLKKDLTSTDSNWNASTCAKYSTEHSYSVSDGNSNPDLVLCIPERSYESISKHSNFCNSNSRTSFSDTSLVFSSPSKSSC